MRDCFRWSRPPNGSACPVWPPQVRIEAADNSGGAHPAAKVMSLLGAMCSGADSIDDADRLRHGALDRAFAGIRAPSTLGTFLRSFTHGRNRQLHRVHRDFLARLATHTPLLPGAGQLMFIDMDPTHRAGSTDGPSKAPSTGA